MTLSPSPARASKLSPDPEALKPQTGRCRGLILEVAVGYGLLQAALWSEGDLRWVWTVAVVLWVIGLTAYHRPSLQELGLGWTGFARSFWAVVLAALVGAATLFGANLAGTLHRYPPHRTLLAVAIGYLVWTLQQQFLLQSFFFLRLEQLLDGGKTVWAAAGLFALAHFPNPVLLPATLVAGLAFCELFRRYRNIYTLAIAQAILGMCVAAAVPDALHHHMHVGIGYLGWVSR